MDDSATEWRDGPVMDAVNSRQFHADVATVTGAAAAALNDYRSVIQMSMPSSQHIIFKEN